MSSKKLFVLLSVFILLVGAAAFLAGRYFVQQAGNTSRDPGPGGDIISLEGPGGERQSFALNIKPAEELPATQPEVNGLFLDRKDNSIFVGTGNIDVMVQAVPGEEPQMDSKFDGPIVEVVIAANTIVYKDTTELDAADPGAEVQQTVELSAIDEIAEQSSIMVWGRKSGDRVIADVLVYSNPVMIRPPQS